MTPPLAPVVMVSLGLIDGLPSKPLAQTRLQPLGTGTLIVLFAPLEASDVTVAPAGFLWCFPTKSLLAKK